MLLLKTLTEGAVTTEAGSFIPVFHDPHRKGRPSPSAVARTLEYLVGVEEETKLGSISKKPLNILKAVMRSSRSRRLCKE